MSRSTKTLLQAAVAVTLALSAGACARTDRSTPTATMPDDYHARHPVSLQNINERLDVFVVANAAQLDIRQLKDVKNFAATYKAKGQGRIVAMLPTGNGLEAASARTLDAIRHALADAHVEGSLSVGTYPVSDPSLAAPVQLSFPVMAATVHSCGEWPSDLATAGGSELFQNKSYYNLGCATQKTLAAQIDDPRDLVRPRAEDPSDVSMRTRAIGNIRNGVDPGTGWSTHNSSIGSVGSN